MKAVSRLDRVKVHRVEQFKPCHAYLEDSLKQVVQSAAMCWTVETLFANIKELMGSDQYQLHSAMPIVRFWVLWLCLYQYLDSLRHRLRRIYQQDVTLGETLIWV